MDEKWLSALETLRTILDQNSHLQNRSGSKDGGLQGSINALSFALGVYSSQVPDTISIPVPNVCMHEMHVYIHVCIYFTYVCM